MLSRILVIFILLFAVACHSEKKGENEALEESKELVFEKTKWREKEGDNYLYRDQMLKDVVYNDTIRSLTKQQLLELLGKPDKTAEGYLYYTISQKHLGNWPLHTKTMVIKLNGENAVEWIKIHQ